MAKEIQLQRNLVALVDDADYELVSQHRWTASRGRNTYYAITMRKAGVPAVLMHNLIMGTKGIDHRNRNGLDNRRENLRVATQSQNSANTGPRPRRSSSGSRFRGVIKARKGPSWTAQTIVNCKRVSIGHYATEEEAARAYDWVALQVWNEFAVLNFPELRDHYLASGLPRGLKHRGKPPRKERRRTSRFRGVRPRRHKWIAYIGDNGKQRYLGIFAVEEEAARAFDRASLEKWGPDAQLNFPTPARTA